jgi:hypothetical protein
MVLGKGVTNMTNDKPYSDYASYFRYLDTLRESGVTNMFGAAPYLEAEFGLPQGEARGILSKWMSTFDGESTPEERAAKA